MPNQSSIENRSKAESKTKKGKGKEERKREGNEKKRIGPRGECIHKGVKRDSNVVLGSS